MKNSPAARKRAVELFPLFLKLEGRRAVVVGAGRVAETKIAGLVRCGAVVQVVAPRASAKVRAWARRGVLCWVKQRFRPRHLHGAVVVVAATSSSAVQEHVFREARRRKILCNSVDDPGHCDFYYPAVVRRGALQIAISTSGHSPALAQRLRKELTRQFGPEYVRWLEYLAEQRERLFSRHLSPVSRRRLLHRLAGQRCFQHFVSPTKSGSR